MPRLVVAATTLLALLSATPGEAAFHFAVIDEVMSGAAGDAHVQYVEIRMLSPFQVLVSHTRLTAFDCDGTPTVLIDDLPSNIANGGIGVRWIMASPGGAAFMAASGISPDFVWDDAVTGSIPTTCGQVCWGAPDGTGLPPNPPTWDAADPDSYIDCVAYGAYTGPQPTGAGAPAGGTPGDGTRSLTRTGGAANANSFAPDCPSPTNNDSQAGGFGPCTPATSTTTTSLPAGATTTTTAPGAPAERVTGQRLVLKANPAKPSRRLLTVSSTDGASIPAPPALAGALAAAGGSLRVVSAAGDGFDDTYVLPAANWRCRRNRCRYRDPGLVAGPIARVLLGTQSLHVLGRGAGLGHTLGLDPTPVGVVLTLGNARLCMRFGGAPAFRADRRYRAADTGVIAPCP